jgi:hypothetical protein
MPLSLHKSLRSVPIALALAIGIPFPNAAANDQVPKVRVESVRRVFHNGEHNAFTDLCRFNGRYYLAFRSCPDGHGVHPTSSIIVLASGDTKSWQQVHRFRVPRRDTRDPHFLIFKGKLFVYTGTWYCGKSAPKRRDMNEHLGYAVWTVDGRKWHGPTMLEGTYGHYVWRAATFGSKAYLCARRKRGFARTRTRVERDRLVESAMLESDDGLVWKKVCLFQERYGDETAFQFDKDGRAGHRTQRWWTQRSNLPVETALREMDAKEPGPLHRRSLAGDMGESPSRRRAPDGQRQGRHVAVLVGEGSLARVRAAPQRRRHVLSRIPRTRVETGDRFILLQSRERFQREDDDRHLSGEACGCGLCSEEVRQRVGLGSPSCDCFIATDHNKGNDDSPQQLAATHGNVQVAEEQSTRQNDLRNLLRHSGIIRCVWPGPPTCI